MQNDFVQLMKNRLVMGAFRYGLLVSKHKQNYDYFAYLKYKLKLYRETGNLEMLVDVGNMALLEYLHPSPRCLRPAADGWAFMRRRLLERVGVFDTVRLEGPDSLYQSEWNLEFELFMQSRLRVVERLWETHDEAFTELSDWYSKYHIRGYLVGLAATAACEFQQPEHPSAHWDVLHEPLIRCPTR